MDFFEHQERARKASGRLVVLFGLAVAGIVASVYLAVVVFLDVKTGIGLWQPQLFLGVAGGVLAVMAAGSLFKTAQLKGGGGVVARRLGGRRVDPGTTDLLERRLLNVVQEMAIASGTPVPETYLMDGEPGINAFAASHGEGDAVIAVTRGALEKLSRDELQGVMGHEFSHLLNGDMRLNLRLMGVLHGILLVGIIGRVLMHTGADAHGGWTPELPPEPGRRRPDRAAGPRAVRNRLHRHLLRQPHQGRRFEAARVPGRRIRGPVLP